MKSTPKHQLWGIVLAAGEGTRVREFLAQVCGGRGIKQFCAVTGCRSMLQHTLDRVEQLIPRERTLIVVSTNIGLKSRPNSRIGQQRTSSSNPLIATRLQESYCPSPMSRIAPLLLMSLSFPRIIASDTKRASCVPSVARWRKSSASPGTSSYSG